MISISIAYNDVHRTSDNMHIWVLDIMSEVGYHIGSPIYISDVRYHIGSRISHWKFDIILEVGYTYWKSDIHIGSQIYISEL